MIRVILCDDHAMIRRGIKETLSEAVDIQVVAAKVGSYSEVREVLRAHPCDVLVLDDINLPGRWDWRCWPVCARWTPPSKS